MSLDACADLVNRGDPDRFRSAMLAPMPIRGDLLALYAFNLEVARAPWVTNEPMIACLLYTSPSPRDLSTSRMPSSA